MIRSWVFCLTYVLLCPSCQQGGDQNKNPATTDDLLRGELILCSGKDFGEVNFNIQCKTEVRDTFDLAISLLHSFEYDEAEKAFAKVIDADPNCAMAYWGVAMSLYHALWAPANEEQLQKGAHILAMAANIPKTPREQAYFDAILAYYSDWDRLDASTRAQMVTGKMAAICETYPDDVEAKILYALTLNATADPADQTFKNQIKAGALLEELFTRYPNHPGIAHYIIHNYDNPRLAARALSTARAYARIAPASAHAQHMPSHIFTRLGLWDESISSNLNSVSSAKCYAESAGMDGHWDEELHGMDYLVYAYLQTGDNTRAVAQDSYLNTMQRVSPENFKTAYAAAAIPARIALENKDWKSAAQLTAPTVAISWKTYPWQEALIHFARALGATHLGDTMRARMEIDTLSALHARLTAKQEVYQANQVDIQIKTATAWDLSARGATQDALALMEEAADMEDGTSKHPVTPCELIPARELYADLLFRTNHPEAALEAYRKDLLDHPGRFNGIVGAALAAEQLGLDNEAASYYQALIALAGTSSRPELSHARAFLGMQ